MIRKLTKNEYAVSSWSGGTTTQIAIAPPEARYAQRDFLWRVSSAAVELEESNFTPLPDYERLISTLSGEITLSHNGGAPLRLRPFEVHAFSGDDATHSRGRCRDFNLMLRRGRAAGSMEALRLTETPLCLRTEASAACPPSAPGETCLLYCVEGIARVAAPSGCPQTAAGLQARSPEGRAAEPKEPSRPAGTGQACAAPITLAPDEALLVTEPAALSLSGPALLMLCRMRSL